MAARLRSLVVVSSFALLALIRPASANENWPQWRGPNGNGVSDSKNLPTTWSPATSENIVWKVELPAWSGSTPVIWGDYIFLTSPGTDDGSPPPADERGKGPGAIWRRKGGFGGKGFGDKGKDGKGPPAGLWWRRWSRRCGQKAGRPGRASAAADLPVEEGRKRSLAENSIAAIRSITSKTRRLRRPSRMASTSGSSLGTVL